MLRSLISMACPQSFKTASVFNRLLNCTHGSSHFGRVTHTLSQFSSINLGLKRFGFNSTQFFEKQSNRHDIATKNYQERVGNSPKEWKISSWFVLVASLLVFLGMKNTAQADEEIESQDLERITNEKTRVITKENFQEIIDQLKKDNPFITSLEIGFALTEVELKTLLNSIHSNTELGYVSWHKDQTAYDVLNNLESKLIDNNKNYRYNPTDYVHGLLSKHAYENAKQGDIPNLGANFDNQQLKDWRVASVQNDTTVSGYYSAIYVNDKTHQVVLAIRGTEGTALDMLKSLVEKNSDWKTNLEEILGGQIIVGQQARNLQATAEAIELAQKLGYRFSVTGHSLGAWLAELSVYYSYAFFDYRNIKAVTFDSPGSVPMMKKLKSNIKSKDTRVELENIEVVTYLASPNPANSCNGHVGRVYWVKPEMKMTEKVVSKLPNFVKNTFGDKIKGLLSVEGHGLSGILATFDPQTGKPRKCTKRLDWPKMEYLGDSSFSSQGRKVVKTGISNSGISTVTQTALNMALDHIVGDRSLMTIIGFLKSYLSNEINQDQYWAYFKYIDLEKEDTENLERKTRLSFDNRFALITLGRYREGKDLHPMELATGSVDKYLYKLHEYKEKLDKNENIPPVLKGQLKELISSFTIQSNGQQYVLIPNEGHTVENIIQRGQRLWQVVPKNMRKVWQNVIVNNNQPMIQVGDGTVIITKKKITQIPDNLPWQIPYYTPIQEKEKELKDTFNKDQVVVISGTKGMGKSALAANYGKQLKQSGWQVRWVKGAQIDEEFQIIKEFFSNPEKAHDSRYINNLHPEAVRDLVYKELEELPKEQQILLIFDNVEDKDKIQQYLKNLPNRAKVIITSKNGKILEGVQPIIMKGFNEPEAISYLREALGNSEDDAKKLIATVGESPFRLSKAIAYLKTHSLMVDDYFKTYEAIKKGDGQNEEIYPEIEMLFNNLINTSPESWQLLKFLAYLDAEGISVKLVEKVMEKDLQELQKYTNILESLSLLSVVTDKNQTKLKVTHRIIQEETKTALLKEDRTQNVKILEKLINEIDKIFPDIDDSSQNLAEINKLIIHAKILIQETSDVKSEIGRRESLLKKVESYYYNLVFDYKETIRYRQELLTYQKLIYPSEHPATAESLDRLGIAYDALETEKDIRTGLKHLKASLRMRQKLFSGDHPDIAESLHNVGISYIKLGGENNLQKGDISLTQSLEMRQNLLSSNHPEIATALKADTHYIIGPDENLRRELKDIADSLNSVGIACRLLKNLPDALDNQKKSLKILRKLFSGNNIDVATVLMDVGIAHKSLKNDTEGLTHLEESLVMLKALFPGNHPYIVDVLNNIGDIHVKLGESDNIRNGLVQLEKSLKMAKELFSDHNPAVADSLHYVAIGYKALGDENKALEYFKQAYGIYSTTFRHDYAETKKIKLDIELIDSKFFDKVALQQDCFAGNKLGAECRWNIVSRGETVDNLISVKQKIQDSVLNNIIQAVDKEGWSSKAIGGDWGVKGYLEKSYLDTKLGELGNNSENIEMAKMLSFESMNLGIMKSVKKPYEVVQSFTRENPELVKKIAKEHPEFFVDGSIVEACIRAMPHDQSFGQHIFDNVKYMGMNERKAKFFNIA